MRMILAGAAALALVAGGALAAPGSGGDGKGKGGGHEGRGQGGGQGGGHRAEQARGPEKSHDAARGHGGEQRQAKANRGDESRGRGPDRGAERGPDRIVERGARFAWADVPVRGVIQGCPPGLAKKHNGCMPPGQLRSRTGFWTVLDQPAWWGLGMLGAGRYFYDDGYLVRYDGDGIDGWLPLLGGALYPGNPWPGYYPAVDVPDYYRDYYSLGPDYRYYDDVLYRVDPESDAITSIAALLTGDRFAVGQPLPLGYDVYNVPYGYRDDYVDGPDAWYRYSDGYVYQVDPTTQLVQAVIELLA